MRCLRDVQTKEIVKYIIVEPGKDVWALGENFRTVVVFETMGLDKRELRKKCRK